MKQWEEKKLRNTVRVELSKKNPYWIEKNRYYELRYFCFQYPIFKKAYNSVYAMSERPIEWEGFEKLNNPGNIIEKATNQALYYKERIDMIEKAAELTDSSIKDYLIKGITRGLSYDLLLVNFNIPCGKEYYYKAYHKFFYILNSLHY